MPHPIPQSNATASPMSNSGTVLSVRGSMVDAAFPNRLPGYLNRLNARENGQVMVEVVAHVNAEVVRGIALTFTSGLVRGAPVVDLGYSLAVPVGRSQHLGGVGLVWHGGLVSHGANVIRNCPGHLD